MNQTIPPKRSVHAQVGMVPAPRPSSRLLGCFLSVTLTVGSLVGPASLPAQSAGTGTIEGRVENSATGISLNNARVAVKGTNLIAFADESGTYRLSGLATGPITLRVFFTGFDEQEIDVNVIAGQTATRDISLKSKSLSAPDGTVQLDAFTVQSTRETDAIAIAVNEQRFAGNITSVVSTDEFGTMVDSNPGEFLKYLPGIDVEYFANNITGVSVRGLGADNTELNFDGMTTASMNAEGVSRKFEVQYGTMADIARAEIRKLPLPQDSANSIGGSINLIRRTAFEYSKRQVRYLAVLRSDAEDFTTEDMDGPKDRRIMRWRPNWSVTWIEPLRKNLGFSLALGQEDTIVNTHWALPRWNLGSAANDALAEQEIAAGRPVPTDRASIYNPGMNNPLNHNAPLQQGKDYASFRADWRPQPELTLGWSLSGTRGWKQVADDIRYVWAGGGSPQYADGNRTLGQRGSGGARQEHPLWRDIYTPAISTVLDARWKKGAWELSGKGGLSYSKYQYYDTEHGFFNSTSVHNSTGLINYPHLGVGSGTSNPKSLTLEFLHDYWGPQQINAFTTASGAASASAADYSVPVNWWSLDEQRINGARARPGVGTEIVSSVKLFAKREFGALNPLSIQLGYDWTDRYRNRRYDYYAWRFVGADGIPDSPDDAARLIAADALPRRPDSEYSYPGTERISLSKLYSLYQRNPGWFRFDPERTELRILTDAPDYDLTETLHAPYVQFDWRLLRNRLRIIGGVRYEKAEATAHGLLQDHSNAYMKYSDGTTVHLNDRDAAGNLLVQKRTAANTVADYQLRFGSNVLPATRSGAPIFTPAIQAEGNALRAAGLSTDTGTNLGRGSLLHTRTVYKRKGATNSGTNDDYFPSLHASYNFTEGLQLQVGYAKTQGRLNFNNALLPNNSITHDLVTSGDGAGALGRIIIQNPTLEPWTADNYEARISYYNNTGGLIGLGLFTKRVKNFQPQIDTEPLTADEVREAMALFPDAGIGPEHEFYTLRYRTNAGSAQLDGAEIEVRQGLDTFLRRFGEWSRGFHFNGTLSYLNRIGANSNELGANRAWTGSASLMYAKRRFSARVGYRLNGLQVLNPLITSNGKIGESVREAQHLFDVSLDVRVTRWATLFAQATNITNGRRVDEQRYMERPAWSNLATSHNLGRTYALGVKGSF